MRRFAAVLIALTAGPAPADGEFLRLEGHGGPVKGVAVSADGRSALTASFDYAAGLWRLGDGSLVRWLDGHTAAVNAAAFHPDGERVLSAGDDFDLIVWERATGAIMHRFEGHRGKILSLAIGPDGRLAATAGWDGTVGLWNLETLTPAGWLEGHGANVNDVAFSADGRTLWSASHDGKIREWDLVERRLRATPVSHGFGTNRLVVDEDARWLAYGAVDGTIRVQNLDTGSQIADLTADRRPILAMALSPDRRRLAMGDGEGHIMVVETQNWTMLHDFRAARQGPIWALAWDRSGRVLAAGIDDSPALWPVSAGEDPLFTQGQQHFRKSPEAMSNGERQFVRKCAICHTLEPDGHRRAGPSLHGIFGRVAGSLPDYRYSEALAGSDIVWTAETIDRLFADGPDHVTPDSKMPMQRITAPEDRADLIAWLRRQTTPGSAPDKGSDMQ